MQTTLTPPSTMETAKYGGFWIRFVAVVIDGILLSIVFIAIGFLIGLLGLAASFEGVDTSDSSALTAAVMGAAGLFQVLGVVMGFLYFTLMESSKNQGTLGKMALGLKVVDAEGNQLSFGKAALRYIGKFVSQIILMIGYIIAAFNPRKQALHDMIASTFVIKK